MLAIYIKADNTFQVDPLQYAYNGGYVNDATLTFTIKDEDGTAISGAEDVAMGYVASSDGKYQGTMDAVPSGTLTAGDTYFLEITATRGSINGFWRIQCIATYKGEG